MQWTYEVAFRRRETLSSVRVIKYKTIATSTRCAPQEKYGGFAAADKRGHQHQTGSL